MRIYDSLPEQAKRDYRVSNRYWKQFETKVAEVSTSLNDHYLKANAQSDGVQSYGRDGRSAAGGAAQRVTNIKQEKARFYEKACLFCYSMKDTKTAETI